MDCSPYPYLQTLTGAQENEYSGEGEAYEKVYQKDYKLLHDQGSSSSQICGSDSNETAEQI